MARALGVKAAIVDDHYVPGDVLVDDDGVVVSVGQPPGRGGLAIPGMVDLQVNGYAGVDFLAGDDADWADALRALARDGVTSVVPTFITSVASVLEGALAVGRRMHEHPDPSGARVIGMHLEGPFLSPQRPGTHPVAHLREPDWELLSRWMGMAPVCMITIAPELPGAADVISRAAAAGVLVSLGHSAATAAEAHAGFDAGARSVTHVFNAMTAPTSRDAGLAGVALTRPDIAVMLICDGIHLQDDVVRLVLGSAGQRAVLVTDAIAGAAWHEQVFRLGEVELTVVNGSARRADGTLAGSILTMGEALQRIHAAGLPLEAAVAAATTRPADLLGAREAGRLRPGDRADIAVLDDDLRVTRTIVGGQPIETEGTR